MIVKTNTLTKFSVVLLQYLLIHTLGKWSEKLSSYTNTLKLSQMTILTSLEACHYIYSSIAFGSC